MKVHVNLSDYGKTYSFIVTDDDGRFFTTIEDVDENGAVTYKDHEIENHRWNVKPFVSIPGHWAFPLYRALYEHFEQQGKSPSDREPFVKGELVATKRHLEDMRTMILGKESE